jgi:triosephosphate isomerase (TIM)
MANPDKPRPLVAGNWKMNGLAKPGAGEVKKLAALVAKHKAAKRKLAVDIAVCPPATLLATLRPLLKGGAIGLGGQDCGTAASGAYTGNLSAAMLKEAGAKYVIVGHSERRHGAKTGHCETDAVVKLKAEQAHAAGLVAIICVGETLAERDADRTVDVVATQLDGSLPEAATAVNTVIAYEPVWAIGTGRTPSTAEVAQVHAAMRQRLGARGQGMRLLYGGSVKGSNAAELLSVPNVDGALVGGASLTAAEFWPIVLGAVAESV